MLCTKCGHLIFFFLPSGHYKPDDQSSEKVTRMLIILNICSVVDVYNPLW